MRKPRESDQIYFKELRDIVNDTYLNGNAVKVAVDYGLIVADEQARRVRAQHRLARAREAEEERDVPLLDANVRGRVQQELPELDRLEVVHDGELVLLHLASPAYLVPRMTISMRLKLISTEVVEDMPLVKRFAGDWPVL